MSGDLQTRKRKGKGKKKDDFEEDVIDTKAHQNNGAHAKHHKASSNGDCGGGGGGGSGVVAKAIFLLLLVSLSVVVALILVELRGKQKAAMMENISVSSGVGEETSPPLPPPPPPAMDEGSTPPEASIPQEPEEEEPEPLAATPPLEEYVKVVREVVVEPLPDEAPVQHEAEKVEEEEVSAKEEKLDDTAPVVEEVIEVVEVVTPAEKVVEIIPPTEEAVEPPSHPSAEAVDDVQIPPAEDGDISKPEKTEEIDATLKEEVSEEPASAKLVEPLETPVPAQQVEEAEEDKLQTEHMDESQDKAHAEKEQPLIDEEEEEDEEEEAESSAPSKQTSREKEVQEEKMQEEEGKEEEEEEEDWSQFGKEGSTGALTDAYLKVEALAEDILALDPQNAMVAQLAPHMAGVLRAMEEGQTEGLLDTLNHIQVILEDVKQRTEEKEHIVIPGPPSQDEVPEPQHQPELVPEPVPEPQSVGEAEAELSSEPETVVEPQPEHHTGAEPELEAESMFQDGTGTQTNVEPDLQTEPTEPVSEMVSEEELKPESMPETEMQTEKEAEVQADVETQTEETAEVQADVETQTEETAEVQADVETQTEETIEEEAGVEAQTEETAEVQADVETQTEEEAGVVEETEETAEVGAGADTQTAEALEVEAGLDMAAETQTEIETDTEVHAEIETETQAKEDAEKETDIEVEINDEKTETEEKDSHTKSEADIEGETDTPLRKEAEIEKEGGIDTEKQLDAQTEARDEVETQTETETQTTPTEAEMEAKMELETETEEYRKPATQEQPVPVPVSATEEHKAPQATKSISEADIADIEAQIIPDGTSGDALPLDPPPVEDEAPVTPQVADGGAEPVPVDEVIPDPIHIEPLQELAKEPLEEAVEEKPLDVQEKDAVIGADDDSVIDSKIREELDQAEKLLPENPGRALHTFGALLHHNPKSARAIYGRAKSLDQLAETEKSNSKLEQAILTYRSVLDLADEEPSLVPLPLLRAAAERCIDRMKFRGFSGKALRVQQRLLRYFPEDVALRNSMGVTYLLMNQGSAAKEVFEAVLQQWPDDGFAQVHYGFVLKTTYNNVTGGTYYMRKGIESGADGTQDERFFFHLGDALQRQGKVEEAYKIYDEAVERGMFLNRYQRSLYNVDRLTSRPIWTPEQTTYHVFFRKLEENWEVIRNEGVSLLGLPVQDGFRPEAENLKDIGDWKQYELFTKGHKITANCVKAPRTCSLIEGFPAAAGCKRGQVKFSVMQPHTHVHAHTGPTNCRLRAHLGLVVPEGVRLKVGQETTTWEEGKILIFDDSWEHEVWHEGDSFRLVLIVDVWHPELTEHERKTLSPI